ncbi:MAG: hypothetical protein R6V36_08610 [Psychroflexus sp.]
MSIQVGPQGGAIVSKYLVCGDPAEGYFTSIQDAIDQAVADGATAVKPIWIYIKPANSTTGLNTFTENLTLHTGVHLYALPPISSLGVSTSGLINIVGNITFFNVAGDFKIYGCSLLNPGSTIVSITNSPSIDFKFCEISTSTTAISVTGTGSSVPSIRLENCRMGGTTSISWSPASAQTSPGILDIVNTSIFGDVSINSNANLTSQWWLSEVQGTSGSIVIDAGTVNFSFCKFWRIASEPFDVDVDVDISNCWFVKTGALNAGTGSLNFQNCTQGTSSQFNSINNFLSTSDPFNGSYPVSSQAQVQTTDATVTTLVGITVNEDEAITLSGTITMAEDDHSNALGGDFIITARRATAGNVTLIGSPVVNVNSSSAATFDCDVDTGTQTVRVRVTGVAATTYNWVTQYTYQKVLTEA